MVVLQLWVPVSPGEGSASVVHSSSLLWCLLSSRTFLVWVCSLSFPMAGLSPCLGGGLPAVRWRSTPLAVGLGLLAWALTPASAGPRQQSTVQVRPTNKDRKRRSRKASEGNPPLHRGLFGAAQDAERSPGCSASSGPTSSVDGADAGQTRARASVQASAVQRPRATRASRVTDGESWEKEQRADSLILLFQLLASLKLCTSIEIAVFRTPTPPTLCGPRPLQWGLGCLHGRSPLLPQGHASNQQCRSGQPTKTGRDGAGRRERAIPPSTGDC
jgi:hypothetical protein